MKRRVRRKPGIAKRMMVTMLSLVMLLSVFSPGLMASADDTGVDPTVQQTPETSIDQTTIESNQEQLTQPLATENQGNFMDSFIDAFDQQTQSGTETLGYLALSYIAKYDVLKTRIQALDAAAEDYAVQVEALNAEVAALAAAVAASAAAAELTEAEVTAIRAAAVGATQTPASDAPSDDAGLKEQTVTAYVDNMTFAVSGKMPEGASLSVTAVDETVNDYIHTNILGLGALPAGYTGAAYDIKLLDKDGLEFQPTEQVNVGVTAQGITENSDVSVYHLPGSCADDVYAGYQRDVAGIALMSLLNELIGEKVETVNVYDGYYAFLTDGFSVYYVLAGELPGSIRRDDFLILRGTTAQLTNLNNGNYTITYPDGVTAETSGVTVRTSGNTLSFSASNSAVLGTYTIKSGDYSATIQIVDARTIFDEVNYQSVYFTCVRDSTNVPAEPMSGGNYNWTYFEGLNNGTYSMNNIWGSAFKSSPDGFIDLDKVATSSALQQNLQGQNVIGVIDRGTGADTLGCINMTDAQWHELLKQFVTKQTVYISDGRGGSVRLTSDMADETLEDGSYRYRMYPYVIKLILESSEYQKGWHVDCAIVDRKTYSVTYEYNLPPASVIQESNDLVRPDIAFYTPGTDGVEVGVLKLDNTNVTGNTSVTIYDPNTQTTSEYKFLYWSTTPDGSGTRYNPGDTLPPINSNVTLYAIWNYTQTSGTVKIQKNEVFQDPNDTRKDDETSYTFTVTIENAEEGKTYPYAHYTASGIKISNDDTAITSGGNVSLKHGEYIIINNVPGGNVTVTETVTDGAKYVPSWTVNGTASTNPATGTVTAGNQTVMVCTNTYAPLTTQVTVSKTVTGNMGDQAKEFSFTASVDTGSMNGMTYRYSDSEKIHSVNDKTCTFTLKHGQSVVFDKVPIGSTLTVTETESNYTVYIDGSKTPDEDRSASVEVVSGGTASIAFRNDNQVTIDTGIELNSFPFIMMLSSCIVMAVFFFIGKKRMMF